MARYKHYLNVAIEAANGAAKIINERRFSAVSQDKADGSIVTDADTAAEEYLRDFFAKHTPEASVWGEEYGREDKNVELEWVIDPIDGTVWYEMGSPVFGTLIGLVASGKPVVGIISLPATREMVFASQSEGCFYSNPMFTSPAIAKVAQPVESLSNARISAAGLHRTDIWLEKGTKAYSLSKLPTTAKLFRLAGDSIQHALVARGKLDGAIDTAMYPWDNAAMIPCITEAGGVVCGIEGQTENIIECGSLLSASCPIILDELVSILSPSDL